MIQENKDLSSKEMEFSTFYVGDAFCGIDILSIQEINKHFQITRVPQSPEYITGIINLRGRIVTTINLGKKLGLDPVKKQRDNRNIIVDSEGEHIGLLVDAISDVVKAKMTDIEPSPSNIGGVKGQYFKGVLKKGNQLIGILDIDQVLKDE